MKQINRLCTILTFGVYFQISSLPGKMHQAQHNRDWGVTVRTSHLDEHRLRAYRWVWWCRWGFLNAVWSCMRLHDFQVSGAAAGTAVSRMKGVLKSRRMNLWSSFVLQSSNCPSLIPTLNSLRARDFLSRRSAHGRLSSIHVRPSTLWHFQSLSRLWRHIRVFRALFNRAELTLRASLVTAEEKGGVWVHWDLDFICEEFPCPVTVSWLWLVNSFDIYQLFIFIYHWLQLLMCFALLCIIVNWKLWGFRLLVRQNSLWLNEAVEETIVALLISC